jgi:hypothetical protein
MKVCYLQIDPINGETTMNWYTDKFNLISWNNPESEQQQVSYDLNRF